MSRNHFLFSFLIGSLLCRYGWISIVELMNLIEQADEIPFYSWEYDGAYDKDEFGSMIYTTMSPEKNYGYEMVEQTDLT